MNGIYNFEQYRTPYLDVDMLMEYKAKKREKSLLVFAGVAAVLMLLLSVLVLYKLSTMNKELFLVTYSAFALYLIAGAVVVSKMLKKKGDYLCLQ